MNQANWRGDTSQIYKIVNTLANKSEKPPRNLTTDGQGNLLTSAADVANRWQRFLSNKFAATPAEQGRSDMPELPSTVGQGGLTDKEIADGLAKMKESKACGTDAISLRSLFSRLLV